MFEYLSMLRHAGPQEWAYREMATIAGMKFKSVSQSVLSISMLSWRMLAVQLSCTGLPRFLAHGTQHLGFVHGIAIWLCGLSYVCRAACCLFTSSHSHKQMASVTSL